MQRDVFQGISDPTRRAILGHLSHNSMTMNELSARFDISRPAVSKQVRILRECGLVEIRKSGRERYCSAQWDKLKEVTNWIHYYQKFWEEKLQALELLLCDETQLNSKK